MNLNVIIKVPEESEIILPCISISKRIGTDKYMVNIHKEMNDKPHDNKKSWVKSLHNIYNVEKFNDPNKN